MTANSKAAPHESAGRPGETATNTQPHSNTLEAQRTRLLCALKEGTLTTIQARERLDIMHPAARVMEWRKRGVAIETHWITEPTACGKDHRVARYLLVSQGGKYEK
jgi:hypothetical protein